MADSDSDCTKAIMTSSVGRRLRDEGKKGKTHRKIKCEISKNKPEAQLNILLMVFITKLKDHINWKI